MASPSVFLCVCLFCFYFVFDQTSTGSGTGHPSAHIYFYPTLVSSAGSEPPSPSHEFILLPKKAISLSGLSRSSLLFNSDSYILQAFVSTA